MHLNSLLDVLPGVFFLHKVSGNLLKAGGWLTVTIKFGEKLDRICFDCFSYFISMGISIPAPQLTSIKFGEMFDWICLGCKPYFFLLWLLKSVQKLIISWGNRVICAMCNKNVQSAMKMCNVQWNCSMCLIVPINRCWLHHHCHRQHQHSNTRTLRYCLFSHVFDSQSSAGLRVTWV